MFPVGVYNVEDYPLNWIDGTYYSTYKGNTFQVSSIENVKSEAEYSAVTRIDLNDSLITTDFSQLFFEKFTNLERVYIFDALSTVFEFNALSNNIQIINIFNCDAISISISNKPNLASVTLAENNIETLSLSNLPSLTFLNIFGNELEEIDLSTFPLLNNIRLYSNKLDNLVNSQVLIDLDNNGLSNGYLNSTIFGGGSLTTAGQTAKTNLLSKGWTIVGI